MPDIYTLPRVPVSEDTSRRPCGKSKHARPHVPGTPVVLGWPVYPSCPAPRHNTLEAGRPRGATRPRCICPRAKALYAEVRRKDREKHAESRRAAGKLVRGSAEEIAKRQELAANGLSAIQRATERRRNIRAVISHCIDTGAPRVNGNRAACAPDMLPGYVDPEYFFLEGHNEAEMILMAQAVQVCWTCPIQATCLKRAVEAGDRYGIRGGLLPAERLNPSIVTGMLRVIESGGVK